MTGETTRTLRLRQAVVAAADREAVVEAWQRELDLGAPFHDPGVEVFGLHNAVLPVGDAFLEVVSPLVPGDGCAAERYMRAHGGDCGYMAIFQVEDLDVTRSHLGALGMRSVLDLDLEDIRGTHVHPADIGGAIVSFDQPVPPESWRWAGPRWTDEVRTATVTGLAGLRLSHPDPEPLQERWAAALGIEPQGDALLLPDGSRIRFARGDQDGIVGIDLWAAAGVAPRSIEVAGVELALVARAEAARA